MLQCKTAQVNIHETKGYLTADWRVFSPLMRLPVVHACTGKFTGIILPKTS